MKLYDFIKQRLMSNEHVHISNLSNKLLYTGYVKLIPYYLIDTDVIYASIGGNEGIHIYVKFNH